MRRKANSDQKERDLRSKARIAELQALLASMPAVTVGDGMRRNVAQSELTGLRQMLRWPLREGGYRHFQ